MTTKVVKGHVAKGGWSIRCGKHDYAVMAVTLDTMPALISSYC